MSQHARTISVIVLVVSAWALSATLACAQVTTSSPQQLQRECDTAKAELAALNNSANVAPGLIAALQQQIILSCRPNFPPPPQPVSCGMDENGAQTGLVNYVQVYSSNYAKWCVDATFWPSNSQYIEQFFTYYDGVVQTLISLSNINPPLPIVVEVRTPTGGACSCGPRLGGQESLIVTGDAFSNTFQNPKSNQSVPGFWGWLLLVHESVNAFTGFVSGGWPDDWWADERSPFPNAMDYEVMQYIGTAQNNQTLLNAAAAQYERFLDPSQAGYDSEVAMFVNFYNQFGGFPAYSSFFRVVKGDALQWTTVSQCPPTTCPPDRNHGQLLSEYVIAYLSMAFGTTSDLTPVFTAAGVGTIDTSAKPSTCPTPTTCDVAPYSVVSANVKSIANAHCSISAAERAGHSAASQLSALQNGNYPIAIASGGTSGSCPAECSWNQAQSKCIAKW